MQDKLYIPNPKLQSPVGKLIVELEPIRNRSLSGSTPPWVFFETKTIFQIIESVTSTRIEGNHTTVADFVEAVREDGSTEDTGEEVHEIENVEKGIHYIESLQQSGKLIIDKPFILQLHRIVVDGLDPHKEGDSRAGAYRTAPRHITKSAHIPPAPSDVNDFMKQLIEFINEPTEPQLDILKTAVVHHRFVWVHPFGNGNGRVVRLLTYAMLAQAGFIDIKGRRLLDPAAVFGKNRNEYYKMLAQADDCSEIGTLIWCEYMLDGLKNEASKIDKLLDENFVKPRIILPALNYALDKKRINDLEYKMLEIAMSKDVVRAGDFASLFPGVSHVNISLAIRRLKEQRLLRTMDKDNRPSDKGRKYSLRLSRNAITLGVVQQLDKEGFLPQQIGE